MEPLNPELWKEIFTDSLYLIPEAGAPVMTAEPVAKEPAKTAEPVKAAVEVKAPVETKKEQPAPLPESPRLPVQPKVEAVPVPSVLKPEGKYMNGVLILLHESQKMTPTQQEMLAKIVKAVQQDLSDCGVLAVASPLDLSNIATLKPRFILSFGIAKESFKPAFTKEYYMIQKHGNSLVLLADALGNLEKNDTLKRNLWNALKELFSIK